MTETVFVALLSLAGTAIGSLSGILAGNRLIQYRLDKLEAKVEKHNSVIERTFRLEGRMTEAEHDICDLKKSTGSS